MFTQQTNDGLCWWFVLDETVFVACIVDGLYCEANDALYYMKKMMVSSHASWYHMLQNTAPPYLHENLTYWKP